MDLSDARGTEARFRSGASDLAAMLGHADRVGPFEDYGVGPWFAAEERKTADRLTTLTAPERTAAQHESLLSLVAQAPCSHQAVPAHVWERVLPSSILQEAVQT